MHRLLPIVSACLLAAVGPADAATKIKVLMKTTDGGDVTATVKVKIYPSGEVNAYVLSQGNGFAIISLDRCDDFVSITAVPNVVGISRKINDQVPDWLPCKEPEVVFNDFQIQRFVISVTNQIYGSADFWMRALGPEAVAARPDLPENLAAAFQAQEYGKISVITTELQQALRVAGKPLEANFLYSLAVDAAAHGVLSAENRPDLIESGLQYSPETNRFELSMQAQAIIRDYQTQTLGVSQASQHLGVIDWSTMRSLPGGAMVNVKDVSLDAPAARSFGLVSEAIRVHPP